MINSGETMTSILNLTNKIFKMRNSFLKKGFTLSEVLITIAIIGIVAAITLPTLLNKTQDAKYKTAYKKAFSVLSQALAKANNEDLIIDAQSNSPRPSDFDKNFLAIMSQFSVVKQCTTNNNSECWVVGEKYGLDFGSGYPAQNSYAFVDSSGFVWSQFWYGEPEIFVDTNGFKEPNQWGKDRFAFMLKDINNVANKGIPVKVLPYPDNAVPVCTDNVCETQDNYYGTTWLYQ